MGLHLNTILALVLELNNHRCDLLCWIYFSGINGKERINQLLKSPSSVGRYKSARIDEGSEC